MPMVQYCRKCKAEVPLGESCAYCGNKLAQTGEMISFGVVRAPLYDWFAWNQLLRMTLPVLALVTGTVLAAEYGAAGQAGVIALIEQGFVSMMLGVLALTLGLIWLMLKLQGVENVHMVLDKQGVHVRTYLPEGRTVAMAAHLTGMQAAERLAAQDDRPPLDGLVLVRRITLPWTAVRRVRIWREGGAVLFFRPSLWQAAVIRCPAGELEAAESYVRKKLKRQKKVKIEPRSAE